MTDYSEHGAIPVEDAVVDDPPTVDEVIQRQRKEYPDQAATAVHGDPRAATSAATDAATDEVDALLDAGGTPVDGTGEQDVEGPNPA
jgi:hypothetical protein